MVLLQAGAAAVHEGRVLLLPSTRIQGRWVIPKGHIERGQTPPEAAAMEAFEEGGVVGEVGADLGFYFYHKRGCEYRVSVFLLTVTEVLEDWPEKARRRRLWLPPAEAAARVEETKLQEILVSLIEI